jgi:nucleoside-diphosphate-sugar epimerase
MRVLMTGGFGCIGSWVAKQLVERGDEVWIYDLKEDRHRLDLLLSRDQQDRVRFIAGDVCSFEHLRDSLAQRQITNILHLAGLQVPICRADPLLGGRVNVLGTLAVFEAVKALTPQIDRVVYASSAAVHGRLEGEQAGSAVDDAKLSPTSHYGAFKVCNELNARVYWLDHGLSSIGLRPWTVYGVGRDFGVTSEPTKAIKAVAANRSYHITYGGKQDLQYVADVAAAFVRALEVPFQGAGAFNVRGDVIAIEDFVSALCEIAPRAKPLVTHGNKQLPIAPDLDDAGLQSSLGPMHPTPLHRGIRETLERFEALATQGRLDLSDLG